MMLLEFFEKNTKCALGYSGGVDSAYLLYFARKHNVDIKPYFVKSAFTTETEYAAALEFAKNLGCDVATVEVDVLSRYDIVLNKEDRCYYCKKLLFEEIISRANDDGYKIVIEGTNASDDIDDRPGFKAISELGVISPLKICGVTKDMLRAEFKNAGVDIWNKPSSACLATRIPTGIKIEPDDLKRVEYCEKILYGLGFSDFRVRIFNNAARIQLKSEYFALAAERHKEIYNGFKPYFVDVFLDFKER